MTIIHDSDYDPAKRREYYLKTRKLKGRSVGKGMSIAVPRTNSLRKVSTNNARDKQQKELETRINKLKARLERLRVVLKAMVEAAQRRSGIEKNTAEKEALEKEQPKSSKLSGDKKTQKEKDEAAKAAKEYREKNQTLESQVVDLTNKINAIRERIKRLREDQNNSQDRLRRSRNKLTIQ